MKCDAAPRCLGVGDEQAGKRFRIGSTDRNSEVDLMKASHVPGSAAASIDAWHARYLHGAGRRGYPREANGERRGRREVVADLRRLLETRSYEPK